MSARAFEIDDKGRIKEIQWVKVLGI
jgi:hypothetical protein